MIKINDIKPVNYDRLFCGLNKITDQKGRIYKRLGANQIPQFFRASGFFSSIYHFFFSKRISLQDIVMIQNRVSEYLKDQPLNTALEVQQVFNRVLDRVSSKLSEARVFKKTEEEIRESYQDQAVLKPSNVQIEKEESEEELKPSYFSVNHPDELVCALNEMEVKLGEEEKMLLKGINIPTLAQKIKENQFGIHFIKLSTKSEVIIHLSQKSGKPYKIRIYQVIGNVGVGGCGEVYKVKNILDKKIYALKKQRNGIGGMKKEIDMYYRLGNDLPHVVKGVRYQSVEKEENAFLMPLYQGDLGQYLKQEKLTLPLLVTILTQLLIGLDQIHKKGIFHTDLHEKNIFFKENPNKTGHDFYIGDFGVAEVSSKLEEDVQGRCAFNDRWQVARMIASYVPNNILSGRMKNFTTVDSLFSLKNLKEFLEKNTNFSPAMNQLFEVLEKLMEKIPNPMSLEVLIEQCKQIHSF